MCLETVDETYPPNDDMVVGYKVFNISRGKICGQYKDWDILRKEGVEYRAKGKRISYGNNYGDYYESGFHTYTSIEDAKEISWQNHLEVFEVHVWDIRARGKNRTFDKAECVVAKNMRIIKHIS